MVLFMNIKQALAAIRALGLTASYSSDWQEFTINYRRDDSRRTEFSDYKTQDAADAVISAAAMAIFQRGI